VGTGEPVHEHDRSGEEPDLMEVDQAVQTGDAPVREVMEERTGVEPVPEEVEEEIGAMPVRETGEGDLHFEDYPGDDFEKVGSTTTVGTTPGTSTGGSPKSVGFSTLSSIWGPQTSRVSFSTDPPQISIKSPTSKSNSDKFGSHTTNSHPEWKGTLSNPSPTDFKHRGCIT